ncbi:MAG: HEAT repeat domain-containing protein [Deltaproteobacteria bacterium]|nr:HEAT repeat domain-containing protein [Deltaproteobacteria bacterium]
MIFGILMLGLLAYVEVLIARADDPKAVVQSASINALSYAFPDWWVDWRLRRCLRHGEAKARRSALEVFVKRGTRTDAVISAVGSATGDPDIEVRVAAIWALSVLSPHGASASRSTFVQAALHDESPRVRIAAIAALSVQAQWDPSVMEGPDCR